MVTRDEDDPRNKEEGESGPGGVRMVVPDDLFVDAAMNWYGNEELAPGRPMFEELSNMKVRDGRGAPSRAAGMVIDPWAAFTSSLFPLLPLPCQPQLSEQRVKISSMWFRLTNKERRRCRTEAEAWMSAQR
jgi:hypothetical protein